MSLWMQRGVALPSLLVAAAFAVARPAAAAPEADSAPRVRHALLLRLDPARGTIEVTDTLFVPARVVQNGAAEFLLHSSLQLAGSEPAVTPLPLRTSGKDAKTDAARFFGINASASDLYTAGKLGRYRVALPPGGGKLVLRYGGPFNFGLGDEKEQYARGFRSTDGVVASEGVYLAGEGFWYPHFDRELVEYRLAVTSPEGWQVVSPGNGTARDAGGVARWDSHGPVDEITVSGGPLLAYRGTAGAVETQVYLRKKDDALAAKYLEATAQYLEMYRQLIGPYPYSKFALVENFWETGYGMPSYTLLGEQVIRLPFILTSSYPHEILHNWWGNSVFVDYERGNWCEGLTAYMADYLIQEQRGRGAEYRRDVLQKYRNYVRDERDFPLAEFRVRHSAATEAVGYGKALMLDHMVRQRIGDDAFRNALQSFYREFRGKQASFTDLERAFEAAGKQDLGRLFEEQVKKPGAAQLAVESKGVTLSAGKYTLAGIVRQKQSGAAFALDVPVVVQTAGKPVEHVVHCEKAATPFQVEMSEAPLALYIDPAYDVFRLLDPREIPASIGQLFGEPKILAVLPAAAPEAEREGYRKLIESWTSDAQQPEIKTDAEVRKLPPDRAVWLLGRENKLALQVFASSGDYTLDAAKLTVGRESMPLAGHSVVLVRRHPASLEKAVGWIFADGAAPLPGLGRKLPHYGKYSYLGFEGDEPANVLKGQWTASDSPLQVDLRPASERATAMPPLALAARKALAELPPVFSQRSLEARVAWLASPALEGRGVGTRGLDLAADSIAAAFKAAGLLPGGDAGSYFQSFTSTRTPTGKPATLRNVIGVLRGTNPSWAGQSALLTAHYDHLGFGWPDVHKGDEGKLHPGADDNASGVAVLLELAKSLAAGDKPQRTLVFVAFTGEESGLQGSTYYVEHPTFPLAQVIGVINLDTVGRLSDRKISVLGTGSASEWQHIFRGAGFVTGIEGQMIPGQYEASDQKSFIDKGVPAVQIFTDAHADYHRPSDTADKIDGPGLVKVATFVREGIQYLGDRAEPLTNTIATRQGEGAGGAAAPGAAAPGAGAATPGAGAGTPGTPASASGQGRKVLFGTMPDFAFQGPGVKVAGLTPGSPAERAGIAVGDVLRTFDGKEIADLRAFSGLLRALAPGQTVQVGVDRNGKTQTIGVTVVEK